jgi:Tetratricopeptide repeat
MLARTLSSLVCTTLLACTGQPTPVESTSAPPVEAAMVEPPTTSIPEDTSRAPVPLPEIGMPSAPQVSEAASKENGRALAAHRAGDYAAARDGFTRAIEQSPDHDLARYNLACALSRLGELDQARRELSTLLHRDLRRFEGRWRGERADPDLEALRGWEHAVALDALVPRLRAAYERAHDVGVPAYVYRHRLRFHGTVGSSEEEREHGGTTDLVAGIYLHDVRRFVPLTHGGDVALLDLPHRRALHVETSIWQGESHMIQHGDPELRLVSTSPDPAQAFAAKLTLEAGLLGIDAKEDLIGAGLIIDLRLGWSGEGLEIDLHYRRDEDGHEGHIGWLLKPDGTREHSAAPIAFDSGMELLREGARFITAPPAGLRLHKRTLVVEGRETPIELDRAYDQVFAAPDRRIAIVLDHRHEVEHDARLVLINDTTVSRVDVSTGKVERLAEGPGAGWVVLGPDGALYVEAGGTTRRWATSEAEQAEPTLEGLHLAMPIDEPLCEGCG